MCILIQTSFFFFGYGSAVIPGHLSVCATQGRKSCQSEWLRLGFACSSFTNTLRGAREITSWNTPCCMTSPNRTTSSPPAVDRDGRPSSRASGLPCAAASRRFRMTCCTRSTPTIRSPCSRVGGLQQKENLIKKNGTHHFLKFKEKYPQRFIFFFSKRYRGIRSAAPSSRQTVLP